MFGRQGKNSKSTQFKSLKDLIKMLPFAQLLADKKRQNLLKKMRMLSALEDSRYESLCLALIHTLCHYYQSLPETSNNYYSQPGGLLDHALNRTEAALSLFSHFILLNEHAELSEKQKLWQYALFSAALLQGIGKLFIDYKIHLFDSQGHLLKPWNPLLESLSTFGKYYDYSFEKESDAEFRKRLNLLLARSVIPVSGFSWIASDPEVLAIWLALINEDQRSAGTLGAILIRADAIAIQRYFNRFMMKGYGGQGGGRYGRARAFNDSKPESISDIEQHIGAEFIQWLTQALAEGKIQLNKAPLFMVPGGMLMSTDMYKLFVRENPAFKNWQAVQNAFLSLGLHEKAADGTVITRFEQTNNQQIHSGIVLKDYAIVLPEKMQVHNMSTGKTVSRTAMEVVNSTEFTNHFVRSQVAASSSSLKQLSALGKWQQPETTRLSPQSGVKHRG